MVTLTGFYANFKTFIGYFPSEDIYQKSGEQRMTCTPKGKWYDEKGNMTEAVECIKGCIARPTLPPGFLSKGF